MHYEILHFHFRLLESNSDKGGLRSQSYLLEQNPRKYEARSAEINPLVITTSGEIMTLDARITVDDYAVFRHADLGIEMAREFDRPNY